MADIPLIPRRALFGNPDKASVQLSPDGAHVAYLAPQDGVLNVWMAPRERLEAARPENNLSFYAIAEAFLSRCLGGRYEPIGDDFRGASLQVLVGAEEVPGLPEALRGRSAAE